MTARTYAELSDVVSDPDFPDLDLALRRGQHVDREDFAWYTLLTDAQDHLEAFYRRYGCELVHKADGYFYLLPTGEKLSRRQLSPGDMLVGQALALLYLDPSTVERGGRATTEDVIAQLAVVLGGDALIRAFHTTKRKYDERVAQKAVRSKVADGVRHLAALGFVEVGDAGQLRLRPALLRFAEPVRGTAQPAAALAKLVADGEIALVTDEESSAAATARDDEHAGDTDDTDGDDADGHDPDGGDTDPDGDDPDGDDVDEAATLVATHDAADDGRISSSPPDERGDDDGFISSSPDDDDDDDGAISSSPPDDDDEDDERG